jgi:hypothetical protein
MPMSFRRTAVYIEEPQAGTDDDTPDQDSQTERRKGTGFHV